MGIILFSLIVIISACSGKNKIAEKKPVVLSDFSVRYEKESKYIKFDTDVIVRSHVEQLYKSIATKVKFYSKAFVPIFRDSADDSLVSAAGNNYIYKSGNSLYAENDYLGFNSNSKLEKYITSSFSLFPEQYTADKFVSIENPNALMSLKGKREIERKLDSLGIKNLDFYKAYQLDYKTLQENEKHTDNNGNDLPSAYKDNWSEGDNSAWWIGAETWQGLPVFCTSFYAGMTDTWAPIQVLYTKNGIDKLQVLNYFNFAKKSAKVSLKPFKEVADSLEKKYSLLLTDNHYIATKEELYYWVDVNQDQKSFAMTPVWIFTLKEYKEDPKKNYKEYQELVNAETAQIMEVGE